MAVATEVLPKPIHGTRRVVISEFISWFEAQEPILESLRPLMMDQSIRVIRGYLLDILIDSSENHKFSDFNLTTLTIHFNEIPPLDIICLDPDIKARWVAALRSGEYKERSKLEHQSPSMRLWSLVDLLEYWDSLGVLVDVVDTNLWHTPTNLNIVTSQRMASIKSRSFTAGTNTSTSQCPSVVLEKANMSIFMSQRFSMMGDAALPFVILADFIEKFL